MTPNLSLISIDFWLLVETNLASPTVSTCYRCSLSRSWLVEIYLRSMGISVGLMRMLLVLDVMRMLLVNIVGGLAVEVRVLLRLGRR